MEAECLKPGPLAAQVLSRAGTVPCRAVLRQPSGVPVLVAVRVFDWHLHGLVALSLAHREGRQAGTPSLSVSLLW